MKFPVASDSELGQIRLQVRIAMALWITLITLSCVWNWRQMGESVIELATTAARSSFDKDVLYRRWATVYWDVYVTGDPGQATEAIPLPIIRAQCGHIWRDATHFDQSGLDDPPGSRTGT